ncbi:MAG: nuclear transport factor 2 family protein [Pseudomonadota bacterium]
MNRTDESRAVSAVVAAYLRGTRDRDVETLKGVFHPNAVMSGYLGPNKLIGSPEPFYAHLEANPHPDDHYTGEITEVEVVGRTARARLVEDNLYGLSFINDFHLINEDGQWSIVSKLFHHD